MDDNEFALTFVTLVGRGEGGKGHLWQHIKTNGGMKRVAALIVKGTTGKKPRERRQKSGALVLSGPPVVSLTLNDGSEYGLTQKIVAEFAAAYPAVDVDQELRAMRIWCLSNPTRRKTQAGVLNFVNKWLAKAQNNDGRGMVVNGGRAGGRPSATSNMIEGAMKSIMEAEGR